MCGGIGVCWRYLGSPGMGDFNVEYVSSTTLALHCKITNLKSMEVMSTTFVYVHKLGEAEISLANALKSI